MARKKKAAKGGKRGAAAAGFAPFPSAGGDAPVWGHLWTLLAVGLALRLVAVFSADWTYRADEIMQYLEQAHRLVFGAGFMPWEIRLGARNLLIAAPAAGVMALCKSVGGGPDCYIPGIELFYAIASLAIPASLYFVGRRLYDETAGRVALAMGCLWYEFVVFAPRLMPEQTAAILILVGMVCVPALTLKSSSRRSSVGTHGSDAPASGDSARRWSVGIARPDAGASGRVITGLWVAGFCVGLGGLLRLQYIPVAGLLGLLILWRTPVRFAPHLIGGAVVSLAVAGGADWIVWGEFLHSSTAFAEIWRLTNGFHDVWPVAPPGTEWYGKTVRLAICSAGLWPLVFVAMAADWRRHWAALFGVSILLVVHAVGYSNSYGHIFLALPLLALGLGGVVSRPPGFLRGVFRGGNKRAAAAAVAAVSALGAAHALPGLSGAFWVEFRHQGFLFYEHPAASAGRFLSRVPPERMRAALWTGVDPIWTGGYYYFHHSVPYWHEGSAAHRSALAGRPLAEVASHIAAPDARGAQQALAAGFREVANFGGVRVFENPAPERVAPVEEFSLGMGHANDGDIDRALERAGKVAPAAEFLPLRE